MYLQLASWAPTGLVRGEHAAFMADLTAMMFQNGIDVAIHIVTDPIPEDGFMDARMKANVRQADLMFFMHWNYWGPLGGKDKAIYMAAFRAMLAQVPGQTFIPPEECATITTLFDGEVDGCVFDVPLGPTDRCVCPDYNGRPVTRVYTNDEIMAYENQPMTLTRLGTSPTRFMAAAVPAMMFHAASSSVVASIPEYK
jgi:hypothetical protein